jgi:hypothetical protein
MQARVNQSCSQSCGVKLKACTAFGEHPEAGEMAHLPPRRRFDRPHTLEHSRYDEQRSKYQTEFYDKRGSPWARRSILASSDRPCPLRPQPSRAHVFFCVRGPYYECNGRGYAVLPGVDIRVMCL